MKTKQEYIELAAQMLPPNYGERGIVMERGAGARVWDVDGKMYLDFLSGIGVVNLGHCNPRVTAAVKEQAETLMHCSNLFLIPAQIELAALLCENSFADRAFFCNSGAEANEAAIKTARRYSKLTTERADRFHIITMKNSFHGRTMATLTATGQDKVQKSFEPLLAGFDYADFNDLASVEALITDHTCAIMLEPVQGEGGVIAATPEFLSGMRRLCDDHGLLLIFDEIQCGMSRCGKLFAHECYSVSPDIMTLAKGLGNGFPIGAMLARAEVGDILHAGTHGTTFGGNPMGCAAGLATLTTMLEENIPAEAERLGKYMRMMLECKLRNVPEVVGYCGLGMMIGIRLSFPGANIVKRCAEEGLIVNCTAESVIRLLPPLIVRESECDEAIAILERVIEAEAESQK